MIKINYYEVLNIPKNADKTAIKRAYFSLVKIHTPDKEPDKFRTLREAYDTLSDEKRRAQYDSFFTAPDYLQNDLISARELIRQTKLKQAIETLTVMERNYPNEDKVKQLLAYAYNKNKNNGKAQKICEELLKKNPNDADTMLLLATVYTDRGYTNKADKQFVQLTEMYPEKQEAWISYIKYLVNESSKGYGAHYFNFNDTVNKALQISEDMFKDDYELYLICACRLGANMNRFFSMFEETPEAEPDAERYFSLFVKFFIADNRPSLKIYNAAISGLRQFIQKKNFFPCMDKLLRILLDSGHRQPYHDKDLNIIRNALTVNKLKSDKRIKQKLFDLVELMAGNCNCDKCKHNRSVLEHNIVFDMVSSRRQIIVLKDNYPDLFKLNEAFYLDMLDVTKERFLETKYRAEAKRYEKTKTKKSGSAAMDSLDDFDPFEDDFFNNDLWSEQMDLFEQNQPYVRESPKIGRNDPCPCGSGKKYKKCCGAISE